MRAAGVGAVLAMCVVGCGGSSDPPRAAVPQFRVHGQVAQLKRPAKPTRKVVLFIHGAEGNTAFADRQKGPLFDMLLEHGYAIAAADAHGEAWGNDESVDDYVTLVRYLRARGLRDIFVLAQSMGGVAAMRLIDRVHPRAWAGIYPVCNLPSVATGLQATVNKVYDGRPPQQPMVARAVKRLPMIFWSSPQDTIVPKRSNTDLCARLEQQRGARVTVVATHGQHGDDSNFDAARLAAFFDAAG